MSGVGAAAKGVARSRWLWTGPTLETWSRFYMTAIVLSASAVLLCLVAEALHVGGDMVATLCPVALLGCAHAIIVAAAIAGGLSDGSTAYWDHVFWLALGPYLVLAGGIGLRLAMRGSPLGYFFLALSAANISVGHCVTLAQVVTVGH